MIINILLLILGLVLISKGGDFFVDSSIDIARIFKVPRVVIGATIVSIGTTLPELMVSSYASLIGDSGIALGNAVGSAIANIGLIVGIVLFLSSVKLDVRDFKRRIFWLCLSAACIILFSIRLYMHPVFAGILLFITVMYLWADYLDLIKDDASSKKETREVEAIVKEQSPKGAFLLFFVGAAMIIIGSRFLVTSGIAVATALGIPSIIIGLSVIAIGTSLPELVTGVVSVKKGVPELSVANVIGANVLNLAMICGVSGLIHPLTLSRFTQLYSFPFLLLMIGMLFFFFFRSGKAGKKQGVLLLGLYVLYLVGLFALQPFS